MFAGGYNGESYVLILVIARGWRVFGEGEDSHMSSRWLRFVAADAAEC